MRNGCSSGFCAYSDVYSGFFKIRNFLINHKLSAAKEGSCRDSRARVAQSI